MAPAASQQGTEALSLTAVAVSVEAESFPVEASDEALAPDPQLIRACETLKRETHPHCTHSPGPQMPCHSVVFSSCKVWVLLVTQQ